MKRRKQVSPLLKAVLSVSFVLAIVVGYFGVRWYTRSGERTVSLLSYLRNPEAHQGWAIAANQQCGDAPFRMPTSGYTGFLWDDSFRPGHRHQGIDIFGGEPAGVTPVYAAYPGYLLRASDWKSTVIIRVPSDPLNPGKQIWTYYTHMADSDGTSFIDRAFPPGTSEVYVEAGTLLGYQGDYSGDPNNPTGIHLHFSIVRDDGNGTYLNELKIDNTIDPSPYLGLPLNAQTNTGEAPTCAGEEVSGRIP